MDPTSIATGGFGAGSKLTGGAGGAGGNTTTNMSTTTNNNSGFDSSGWTVATGSSKATATAGGLSMTMIALIAGAALLGLVIYKKM